MNHEAFKSFDECPDCGDVEVDIEEEVACRQRGYGDIRDGSLTRVDVFDLEPVDCPKVVKVECSTCGEDRTSEVSK